MIAERYCDRSRGFQAPDDEHKRIRRGATFAFAPFEDCESQSSLCDGHRAVRRRGLKSPGYLHVIAPRW